MDGNEDDILENLRTELYGKEEEEEEEYSEEEDRAVEVQPLSSLPRRYESTSTGNITSFYPNMNVHENNVKLPAILFILIFKLWMQMFECNIYVLYLRTKAN